MKSKTLFIISLSDTTHLHFLFRFWLGSGQKVNFDFGVCNTIFPS